MADNQLTPEQRQRVRETRRFDLRRIIGGIFVVYGVIVTIVGLVDPAADTDPNVTGGIAINLWSGLAMLVVGIFFFVWDHFAPVPAEDIVSSAEQSQQLAEREEVVDPFESDKRK